MSSHAQHMKDKVRGAVFRPSHWPGLIWLVPIAALGIVGTLAVRSFMSGGPHTTVQFPTTGGVTAGQTNVEYRGVTVGHVSAVHLLPSLNEMKVRLTFNSSMAGHLGPGTRFWIGGANPSVTDLSSLKSLVSGPFIAVDPEPGNTLDNFVGLDQPPVVKWGQEGEKFTLTTDDPGHISRGAPIYFRHFKVGDVLSVQFAPVTRRFDVAISIGPRYENLVNARTHFWNAGAVHLALGGAGPSVQLESVPALLTGAIAFDSPTGAPVAMSGAQFTLYASRSAAESAPGAHAVPYQIVLAGGPHGLAQGASVTLEGAPAGVVTNVQALYDPASQSLSTLIRVALEPERIARPPDKPWDLAHPASQMNAMLTALIGQGLRAQLGSSTPVIGAKEIILDIVPAAHPASLIAGNPPTIPSVGSSGAPSIMARLSDILAKINALPLPEIASNLQEASDNLAKLSNSPATRQTLKHLDATIGHLDQITEQTERQWPAITYELHASTAEAEKALAAAQSLLNSQSVDATNPESATLPRALYELTRAAESLRALVDYLSRHPNSVIFGKGR